MTAEFESTETIVSMLRRQVIGNSDRPALETRAGAHWIARSFREWEECASCIAATLIDLGVSHGDRVVIMSNTRREWAEVDAGIVCAGAATVPIYQQTTPEGIAHILKDSGAVVAFVEDPLLLEKFFHPTVLEHAHGLRRIVYFDARKKLDRPDAKGRLEVRLDDVIPRSERGKVMGYAELLEGGRRILDRESVLVRSVGNGVVPSDIATIVYTSGTTGLPKGVVLTHGNFASKTATIREILGLSSTDRQLLILPLAHIFAKILLVGAMRIGYSTAFATSLTRALDEMKEVNPTFFGAVPRVYEKIHAAIMQKIRSESPLRRRAAESAFAVGRKYSAVQRSGGTVGPVLALQHRAADLAVLERVRHTFGDRLRFAISGGAPLSREIAEFFHGSGVLILEGYGLTETTAATHMNRPDAFKLGTVGLASPEVGVRIAEDGEILVRGPSVMPRYHNQPDATAEVLDGDGWFHTGDIGSIDHEGYLTITDRKKDLIVTAGGKNVSPQNIENSLKQLPLISQAIVIGDGRPYLVALFTLDEAAARASLDVGSGRITDSPNVLNAIEQGVQNANNSLENYQQIKRWKLLHEDLTVEADELTPTLKVRRKVVAKKYAAEIEALYSNVSVRD